MIRVALDGGNRLLARLRQVGSVAEFNAPRLGSGQCIARPRGDHGALFLSQGCKQMQDEGINVGAKLSHQERHPVRHEPADEVHVAAEPVELGDCHGAAVTSGLRQGRCELRAAV